MTPYIAPGLTKGSYAWFMRSSPSFNQEQIIENPILEYYQVTRAQFLSKSRKREVVIARHLIAYFLRQFTHMSLKKVGENIGGRDHTTVIHAILTIRNLMDTEPPFKQEVQKLSEEIARRIYGK